MIVLRLCCFLRGCLWCLPFGCLVVRCDVWVDSCGYWLVWWLDSVGYAVVVRCLLFIMVVNSVDLLVS